MKKRTLPLVVVDIGMGIINAPYALNGSLINLFALGVAVFVGGGG